MMKKIWFLILGLLLLTASNVFADDVSIDSSGNVKTGVSNTNAELEVTGGSGEGGIVGSASGTGASGVYGINTTGGGYGVLGYDDMGVFGYSLSGYAGYFQGNARVTGNLTVDGTFNVTETDPQVGTLTNGMWCTTNGTQVNCTAAAPVTSETDPQVGTLTNTKWCTSDGTTVNCTSDAPSVSETDPQVGTITTNYVPKWDGSALVTGLIYDNGTRIGIGTASPNEQLEITGNLRLPATTATTGIIKSGADTLIHTYGSGNFFAGVNAGNLTMTGIFNTASGSYALFSNTTGSSNTANGLNALLSNTTGYGNTANGVNALVSNTTATNNTAVGTSALSQQSYSNGGEVWDSHNTAVGYQALYSNQPTSTADGVNNTAVGSMALTANTTGYGNTAIGSNANVSSGALTNATAIGYNAIVNASNKVRIGNSSVTVIEGQVGWSYPSDIRIKKDVQDIGFGLEFVKSLRPVQYRLKQGNDRIDFGFIAQEVETQLGVEYNVLGIAEDADRMLSLRYTDFIAPMVKAMQEQQAEIDSLKSELAEIKALLLSGRY